jgi:type I site-specific restriction endonuclease
MNCEFNTQNITVLFVNDKRFNFDGITKIHRNTTGQYMLYGLEGEVVALIEAQNVTVILPR